jgi:hypothetical protein
MTEGGDIGFRVYYKSAEEGIVDLVPLSRIESHLVMEEGEYICENPGKCKHFKTDNNHSYPSLENISIRFLFRCGGV